jgi:hypothetical protein
MLLPMNKYIYGQLRFLSGGVMSFDTSAAALALTYAHGRFPLVGGTNMKPIKLANRVGRLLGRLKLIRKRAGR